MSPQGPAQRTHPMLPPSPTPTAPLAAALIALVWATGLYGLRAIHPASADWLLHGDAAAHHVGVQFFIRDAWRWPLGVFEGFGETPTSVVFTDGIPWLALVAKAAAYAGWWPSGWQYFGLWMLACHAAAAWWGVRIIQAVASRQQGAAPLHPIAWVAAGLFFAMSPALMMRAYGHEALMAHALVLAALSWAIAPKPWRVTPWLGLAALAVGTHAYLALMVALIGMAAAWSALRSGEQRLGRLLLHAGAAGAVLFAWAWVLGYFSGAAEVSTHGHGVYSANLLTWVDPMPWVEFMNLHQRQAPYVAEWSRLLPAQAQATGGQYEGYAWLGAGLLLVVALAVARSLLERPRPCVPIPVITVCVLLALWALSTRITWGAHTLIAFEAPPTLAALLGVFRASGRFIWPLTYLLMAWALVRVAQTGGVGRTGTALLLAALALQAFDTSPKWAEFHSRFRLGPPGIVTPVKDEQWAQWLARCPRLEWVADEAPDSPPGRWIGPTLAAGLAGAQVLPAPTSHPSAQVQAQRRAHLQALRDGAWRPDTVYVFPEVAAAATVAANLTIAGAPVRPIEVDGYLTLSAPSCRNSP